MAISRVSVRASPAFGRRRLHKNTDKIVFAPASFLTSGKDNCHRRRGGGWVPKSTLWGKVGSDLKVSKTWTPLPWTVLRRTAQNFALTLADFGPPGLHTTARELQTGTFEGPGASNTTKIQRENEIMAGEKKNAKFWASHPSGPHTHQIGQKRIGPSRSQPVGGWGGGEGAGGGRGRGFRGGPEGVGGAKISLFFTSPATMFFLSSFSWGSPRGKTVFSIHFHLPTE